MMTDAPIFTPTMEEFKDFAAYVQSIEPLCKNSGICKIIPPKEWNGDWEYDVDDMDIVIPHPIRQIVTGNKGIFQLLLVEEKPMTVQQFRDMAMKEKVPKSTKYNYDDIERTFWKNIRFNPPLYGADMQGTLLDPELKHWNLQHLDSMLKVITSGLPGITQPYLYFGMFKAMFAWHVEDMNLFSINYLHFGEPKQWYSVPPSHGARFERILHGYYADQLKGCPEFVRHKTSLVSPSVILKHQIPITRAVQEKGQIIITFPYAYHAGFNHGFNCAESVNFALESWVEWGRKAKVCKCDSECATLNVDYIVEQYNLYKEGLLTIDTPATETAKYRSGGGSARRMARVPNGQARKMVTRNLRNMRPTDNKEEQEEEEIVEEIIDEPIEPIIEEPSSLDELADSSDDDDKEEDYVNIPNSSNKRTRTRRMSLAETTLLESYFDRLNGTVDKKYRKQIAKELNWTPSGVYNWFRRKRAKSAKSSPTKTQKVVNSTIVQEVNKTAKTEEEANYLKVKIPISMLKEANKGANSEALTFCCVN